MLTHQPRESCIAIYNIRWGRLRQGALLKIEIFHNDKGQFLRKIIYYKGRICNHKGIILKLPQSVPKDLTDHFSQQRVKTPDFFNSMHPQEQLEWKMLACSVTEIFFFFKKKECFMFIWIHFGGFANITSSLGDIWNWSSSLTQQLGVGWVIDGTPVYFLWPLEDLIILLNCSHWTWNLLKKASYKTVCALCFWFT